MKKLVIVILVVIISSFVWSCKPKVNIDPIVVDFDVNVTGESPDALLTLTNNSQNGESFLWIFGEGAEIEYSVEENPDPIKVDKVGLLDIVLIVQNIVEEQYLEKTASIYGNSGIYSYSDIQFAHEPTLGSFFSTKTGEIYTEQKVNSENGPLIDLAFLSINNAVYSFESPDDEQFSIPGATETLVMNLDNTELSISEFDAITDDRDLKNFHVFDDNKTFGNSTIPHIILFQNDEGRRGAIKTKTVNSNGLLVDIKVQKY